jgi:phosphoserine phosphatase
LVLIIYLPQDVEFKDGKYTGKTIGTPCFQDGKITNLNKWLKGKNIDMNGSYFYSDSFNDLPMLELVDNPVVINGDEKLLQVAKERGWKTDSWM